MPLDLKDANYNELRSYTYQNGIQVIAGSLSGNPTKSEVIKAIQAFEKAQLKATTSRKLKAEIKLKVSKGIEKEIKDLSRPVEERTVEWKGKYEEFVKNAHTLKPILMNEVDNTEKKLQEAADALKAVWPVVAATTKKEAISESEILNAFQGSQEEEEEDDLWDSDEDSEEFDEDEEEETFGDLTEDDILESF